MNKKLSGGEMFKGFLLFFAAAVIPLIAKLSTVKVSDEEYGIIRSSPSVADVFSYDKSIWICVVGAVLLLMVIMDVLIDDKKPDLKRPCFICAGVFLLINFISALFSPYKHIAFCGISERYEGLWVIASYIVLFVCAALYTDKKEKTNILLLSLALSGIFVGIIGSLQYFGIDWFKTTLGNKVVLGDAYKGTNSLSIKFDSVYATLYNPNCVGLFTGMMFPFSVIMAVALPKKNFVKYVYIVSAVLMLICLIGCDSLGGLMGAVAAFVFVVIAAFIYFVKIKNKLGIGIILSAVIVLCCGGVVLLTSSAKIAEKFDVIMDFVKDPSTASNPNFFEDIAIESDRASIYTKSGVISLDITGEEPVLYYNDQESEPISKAPDSYSYNVEGLKESKLEIVNGIYSLVFTDDAGNATSFLFGKNAQGKISVLDKFGEPVDINEPVTAIGFKGMERLGSNRGYIWSRSIPILLHSIIGKGPDTFSLQFPQNDVLGKLRYQGSPYIIVDKPHNFYLQIGINTGILSLIAFLTLIVVYAVSTLRSIFSSKNISGAGVKLAVLAGVIGYLAAGLTTDSVVSVSPVFWILLGLGVGISTVSEE